jgi:hypothetical protein
MGSMKAYICQIVDWSRVDLGTHCALIVGGVIRMRAVAGVTLADLRAEYRRLRN